MIEPSATGIRPRLKVCCIADIEEVELAIDHGANAVGLVSELPSGPEVISDDCIEEIAAKIPNGISTFLLTSSRDVQAIVDQQRRFGVNTIQLCDDLQPFGIDVCSGLRTNDRLDEEKLIRFVQNIDAEMRFPSH